MLPAILKEKCVDHLHYIAPIENASMISAIGIFSHNRMNQIPHPDFSMKKVQWLRENRELPNGKTIHDYVPLYFATHTPMQFVWMHGNTRGMKPLGKENFTFFEIDVEKVFSQKGIYFTDGNAAAVVSQFYDSYDMLDQLDWNIILNEKRCYSKEYRRKKAAEVLVPEFVPPSWFRRVVVSCEETQDLFYKLFEKTLFLIKQKNLNRKMEVCDSIAVEIDSGHYSFL